MSTENGGERDRLAPVIPLFGGPVPERPETAARALETPYSRPPESVRDDDPVVEAAVAEITAAIDRARERRSAAPDRASRTGGEVTALASDHLSADRSADERWHPTWATDRRGITDDAVAEAPNVELAEKALLKKLRTRSLSVSEARGVLREFDLDAGATEHVIASMDEYGYLDDAALADQLIHAGVDRKGQGRQVIAQTLAKRGIPRDIADAALASLPDDDFERALEFARGKARSLRSLDRDTALRRLSGQLARRGYGGSIASSAARAALDESPGGSSGVRFR
ncbi:regulatory protein RecX [Microbacterium sulfonylureivorans]|uniref:regulatory protein RecX n=1 Tax=Microbacterium sulfonylureivorans TaxID=2486854 RepID=UPI000FDBC95B|nr:regulatory protein RecX [Microbacterium sulfonylureivorans]